MDPITRKEYYLAKAAGIYDGSTPQPFLTEDYYLAALCGDYTGALPAPYKREHYYLARILGEYNGELPEPMTRTEIYWAAYLGIVTTVPKPITREEELIFSLLRSIPGIVEKTASGNPITIQSAAAPFTEMLIFGKTTQNGTPSPENPVALDTAGASGQVDVSVGGVNLFDPTLAENGKFQNYNVAEGIFLISNNDGYWITGKVPVMPNTEYSVAPNVNGGAYYSDIDTPITNVAVLYNSNKFTTPSNCKYVCLNFNKQKLGFGGDVMINKGLIALPYQPYVTPQTLIIPTPNGLPGVPTTGEEYTYIDSTGQKWIADSVEYFSDGTGRLVQRCVKIERVFDFNSDIIVSESGKFSIRINNVSYPITKAQVGGLFNIGIYSKYGNPIQNKWVFDAYSDGMGIQIFGSGEYTDLEDLKSKLDGKTFIFLVPLAEPIITPLSAEEVAAFKALTTYEPTTVVQNDAGCWMQVGYKAKNENYRRVMSARTVLPAKNS